MNFTLVTFATATAIRYPVEKGGEWKLRELWQRSLSLFY